MSFVMPILAALATCAASAQTLEEGFASPPRSARPQTWYHMMNGNVTKEGITRDFEEMAKAGLGGVQIFDIGSDAPPGSVTFASQEWFDLMRHAHKEAKRFGLEVALRDSSGWSGSGGRWVKYEDSMKWTVFTETSVKGPFKDWCAKLPRIEKDDGFYGDIAVLAYPTPKGAAELEGWANKTGRTRTRCKNLTRDTRKIPLEETVAKNSVIDLTNRMAPDGSIEWDVPEGEWTVLRLGFACIGRLVHPASHDAGGREIDKLSAVALDRHFDAYLGRLMKTIGVSASPDKSCGVNGVIIDSYEAGGQNWTQGLDKIFKERAGYSIRPWLPVFAKRIVDSVDATEDFLEDFRRVLADLYAENYIGRLAERCREHGLKLWLEPYGTGVFDDLQLARRADVPMGEFWNRVCIGEHAAGGPGNVRLAAYAAHVWGKPVVAAESFTSSPPAGGRWMGTPFAIKSQGDRAYAEGLNVADIAYFTGEDTPCMEGDSTDPAPPPGRQFDYINAEVLKETAKVDERGRIVLPHGTAYEVLVLPKLDTMRPEMIECIERLVNDGAFVVAPVKPVRSPSLAGQPQSDAKVKADAQRLWGDGGIIDAALPTTQTGRAVSMKPPEKYNRLGKGVLAWGLTLDEALAMRGSASDALFATTNKILFAHRTTKNAEIYFVSNQSGEAIDTVEASFRVVGRTPELWDAATGGRVAIHRGLWREENRRTAVTLSLAKHESIFVVFPDRTASTMPPTAVSSKPPYRTIEITCPWTVEFESDALHRGPKTSVVMEKLVDLSTSSDPAVKYYSGKIVYRTKFNLGIGNRESGSLFLDLGDVAVTAKVKVNGKDAGGVCFAPYRLDIAPFVKEGENDLEIEVCNLWVNRLVGDAEDPNRPTWTSKDCCGKNTKLPKSGLIGPVRISRERR